MTTLQDLMSQIPMDQIAKQLGVDQATATAAVSAALPTLVGGLQANAQDPDAAHSLAQALGSHAESSTTDVDQIDVHDGAKIVNNVFGDSTNQVVSALGASTATAGDENLFKKLLPMLAPIVMAFLAKQFLQGGQTTTTASAPQSQSGGGVLGEVLGGMLGGGSKGGGDLGSVLGGALSGQGGNILGQVLGGLLGGGRR